MHQYFHRPLTTNTSPSTSPPSEPDLTSFHPLSFDRTAPDYTSLLSDELLLNVFSKLPISQHVSNSLVWKRCLYLHGRLLQSLKVTDWSFVTSGRVFIRFPNLTDLDLVRSCIGMSRCSSTILTNTIMSVHVDTGFTLDGLLEETALLPLNEIDGGLATVAEKYPNLQRLVAIGASEQGLLRIAEECSTLQELELHCGGDLALKALSGIKNLRVVKLIGFIDVLYNSTVKFRLL
ncbi:F-box protein At5g51380-like [Hibiscus syriacus]|uniref:F-box protein At5g51380-like n=1 Tax=Hibiscus syriacus TaxID=106335 RepID=UPI001921529B|nr:F-box protein At5g51380-like [Hibiscus syriacus]